MTHYDGSCYKHFSDALSWRDAAANCARHDAHLVIINSDDEADWLCTRLSLLTLQQWNLCRAWWTAGASEDGSWVWRQPHSVYDTIIRTDRWFGGRPDAHALNGHRVTMQLENGYFGLIARDPDTRLPSICEKEVDDSDSSDSDTSSRSRGRHSRGSSDRSHGRHSRSSSSSDSDDSDRSHGRHSRGSSSSDSDRSHGHGHGHHSRGSGSHESHGHGHHHRGRGGHHSRGRHGSRYGYVHGQYPRYRQDPYSPYYPRPRLPDTCEQPETTAAPTTTTTETTTTECITHPRTTTTSTTEEPTTTPSTERPTTTEEPTTTRPTTTEQPTTTEEPTTAVISTERPQPCPPGWLDYGSSCYQIHNSCAQTRYIAQTACELLGGHLVTINTPEEEEFLTSKLDKRKEYWISGRYEDGEWYLDEESDSSSSSSGDYNYFIVLYGKTDEEYTNWHQNEPSRNEDGSFAVLSWSQGHWGWRSRPGYEYRHFICEVSKNEVKLGCLTPSCQYNIEGETELNDWERFLDNEYLVHDSCAKTQSDASTTCRQKGGQLLSIKSSEEMRFVQRMLRTRSYDMEDAPNWWTSGMKSLGKWQWQDSKKKFIYTNWGPDIDIPSGNYMVLHYYPFYDEWMWTDTNKSQVMPFICKRAV